MIGDEVLTVTGFRMIGENCYTKKSEDIDIIIEENDTDLKIIVPCASARIDDEHQLNDFLKKESSGTACRQTLFAARKITLIYSKGDNDKNIIESINAAQELINKADTEFDLLPVCSRCERVIPVQVIVENGKATTICDVCKGETELQKKHERIVGEYKAKSDSQTKFGFVQPKPLLGLLKAGAITGLIGSAVGLVLMLLTLWIPSTVFLPYIPGAIAGFLLMRKIIKIDYMSGLAKVMIGSLSSIAVMMIFSLLNLFVFLLVAGVATPVYFWGYCNAFALFNVALGLGAFFLTEVIVFFLSNDV